MKAVYLLTIALFLLLISCKKPADMPIASGPTSTSSTANQPSNDSAQITAVTIPGIPASNVVIDQKNRIIIITAPASLSVMPTGLPLFTTTNPTLKVHLDNVYEGNFCRGWVDGNAVFRTAQNGPTSYSPYALYWQSTATPQIASVTVDSAMAYATLVSIPSIRLRIVNNFINPKPLSAELIQTATGKPYNATLNCVSTYGAVNSYELLPDDNAPSGEYSLRLLRPDGGSTNTVLLKSLPELPVFAQLPFSFPPTVGQKGYSLYGKRLSEAANITFTLTSVDGTVTTLGKPYSFSASGIALSLDVPPDLKPDYYRFEGHSGIGKSFLSSWVGVVNNRFQQPVLSRLPDPNVDITWKRGQPSSVEPVPIGGPTEVPFWLVLTSVANPAATYTIEALLPNAYQERFSSSFTIPATVPAGRYRVKTTLPNRTDGITVPNVVVVQ